MKRTVFCRVSFFFSLSLLVVLGCNTTDQSNLSSGSLIPSKPDLIDDAYNVAFLIMDGVYNTELTAPFDIFQHTQYREGVKPMNVFLVANTTGPIRSFEGIRMLPDYSYISDSLPRIDILVVPSAEQHLGTDLEDSVMISWVRDVAEDALYVTSHCDGAFVLAKAGLLDGVVSTTFPADVPRYQEMFPHLDVRSGVLFVHDGRFITSAGGARSFDAALYLTEILYGADVAESLARGLVIEWDLDQVAHLVVD